ncbi:MAG: hypothetical protein AAF394_08375 [Planctomycetota bacterium]
MPINEEVFVRSFSGLVTGLAIGLTWVQYRSDVERFEAYVDEPDAFEEEIEEPSILRATLPVFFLILVVGVMLFIASLAGLLLSAMLGV